MVKVTVDFEPSRIVRKRINVQWFTIDHFVIYVRIKQNLNLIELCSKDQHLHSMYVYTSFHIP